LAIAVDLNSLACLFVKVKYSPQESALPQQNLYLVGFMGTGKSSIGREVAKALRFRFIDSDRWIEKKCGMKIPAIFQDHGEAWFREREEEFVTNGHPSQGCVVACGGGLIAREGMLDRLEGKGLVVALYASVETILMRTSRNKNRPLLRVDDPRMEIEKLMDKRAAYYQRVGLAVSTDGRSFSDVRDAVIRIYNSHRKKYEPADS